MALTAKELTAIEDTLAGEQLLQAKCQAYAQSCEDPELRKKCEMLAGKHQEHYQTLYSFLQ